MKVLIYISGGVVQSVFSEDTGLEVLIFNEDDLLEKEIPKNEIYQQFNNSTLEMAQIF